MYFPHFWYLPTSSCKGGLLPQPCVSKAHHIRAVHLKRAPPWSIPALPGTHALSHSLQLWILSSACFPFSCLCCCFCPLSTSSLTEVFRLGPESTAHHPPMHPTGTLRTGKNQVAKQLQYQHSGAKKVHKLEERLDGSRCKIYPVKKVYYFSKMAQVDFKGSLMFCAPLFTSHHYD